MYSFTSEVGLNIFSSTFDPLESGIAKLARKNRDENVEMDDGTKVDREDQDRRNMR